MTALEAKAIRAATIALNEDPKLQQMWIDLSNDKQNQMHHLSPSIVRHCQAHGIQALILGHNENWKQDMSLGKANNKPFGTLPHGRLMEQIRYKAEALGIIVVEVEESYTTLNSSSSKYRLHANVLSRMEKASKAKRLEGLLDGLLALEGR